MKKIALLSFIALFFFGCDQPIKSRYLSNAPGMGQGSGIDDGGGMTIGTTSDGGDGGSTTAGTTTSPGGDDPLGPGYENCSLNYQYYGGSFGYFGICQHSSNERQFKTKFQTSNSQGICFVPVHYNEDGTSYKVGKAECATTITSGAIYTVPTTKDVNASINGIMVIKYSSLNSYMQCMNFKANYLLANPMCQYNSTCLQWVDQQAQALCQDFVTYHSNHYKQVHF